MTTDQLISELEKWPRGTSVGVAVGYGDLGMLVAVEGVGESAHQNTAEIRLKIEDLSTVFRPRPDADD
jgi:hypothetical protein